MDPGPLNGEGPGGVSKAVRKYFIDSTDVVAAATTPGCAIEIACNSINVLKDHKSTNGLDDFLGNTSFLCKDVVNVKR